MSIITGATITSDDNGMPEVLLPQNITEINSDDKVLLEVQKTLGIGYDFLGNVISYSGKVNLNGLTQYLLHTTALTIGTIVIKYAGDVLIKNGATYYVNGIVASPTTWP